MSIGRDMAYNIFEVIALAEDRSVMGCIYRKASLWHFLFAPNWPIASKNEAVIDVYVISAEASEFLLKEYFTFWSFCIFREDIPFRWNANIWHIKVCLSHNCTHFSSFFSISKTVESCSRVFQNLLVILALSSRFFIPVTIKKKKVLPVTASFYLGGVIEPPQNICSLSLQGQL